VPKCDIDIAPVRPNVWVVLSDDDPEGGTIIRRFERWTCTCQIEGECRHVTAARSLIAKAASVVDSVRADNTTAEGAKKPKQRATSSEDSSPQAGGDVVFTMLPPTRNPRPVHVADRTAVRLLGKEVAA
jgi:hypothetical protein